MTTDAWALIFEKSEFMKDVLGASTTCRDARAAFYLAIQNPMSDSFAFPRRTFINYALCSVCDRTSHKATSIVYEFDEYPRRIIISCEKWECVRCSLHKFFADANASRTNPFIKCSENVIWIPRTHSGYSVGKPCPFLMVRQGKYLAKVLFEEKRYSTNAEDPVQTEDFVAFKHVDASLLKNLRMVDNKLFHSLLPNCTVHG